MDGKLKKSKGSREAQTATQLDKSISAHIKPSTTTYERLERPEKRGAYRKRGYKSTVHKKIWYLYEQLWFEGYRDTIAHKVLTIKIMDICGADKATVRAYLGYRGRVRHNRRGGLSYVQGIPKKGYLEILGYARREKNKWFLFHENAPDFPYKYVEDLHEFVDPLNPPSKCNERVEEDFDVKKISLLRRGIGINARERPREAVASISNRINNNIPREREIFDLQPKLSSQAQLTPLEKATLRISKEGDAHG